MTTIDTVTESQICALRDEAAAGYDAVIQDRIGLVNSKI